MAYVWESKTFSQIGYENHPCMGSIIKEMWLPQIKTEESGINTSPQTPLKRTNKKKYKGQMKN